MRTARLMTGGQFLHGTPFKKPSFHGTPWMEPPRMALPLHGTLPWMEPPSQNPPLHEQNESQAGVIYFYAWDS